MSVCKQCEGTGKLGFQREDCCFCYGTGYVKEKIQLSKQRVENGLNELIEKQLCLQERLKESVAIRDDECIDRLRLIIQRDTNDYILKYFFDLQSFQYGGEDFDGVYID